MRIRQPFPNLKQEREEREEIERELKAQSLKLNADRDNNGNSGNFGLKDPTPIGLAGLEAFRREYLTSPLSHLRNSLPPGFPGLPAGFPGSAANPPSAAAMTSIAESSFGKVPLSGPQSASSTGSNTPPISGSAAPQRSPGSHRSPSSEFTSQQNWSFEEQFKQVCGVCLFLAIFYEKQSPWRYFFSVLFRSTRCSLWRCGESPMIKVYGSSSSFLVGSNFFGRASHTSGLRCLGR